MKSPKDKYRVQITFDEPQDGIGSVVIFTSDSEGYLVYLASRQAAGQPANVRIFENLKTYPEFDWKEIRNYTLNK